ncbi:MAG: hypothetical protein KC425_27210, partial [Anaerolineales bacterium]|nr:hypothetical protein [Anaerolineales bacterium]
MSHVQLSLSGSRVRLHWLILVLILAVGAMLLPASSVAGAQLPAADASARQRPILALDVRPEEAARNGTTIPLTIRVTNHGTAAATAVRVAASGDTLSSTPWQIETLAAGETAVRTVNLRLDRFLAGENSILVTATANNVVTPAQVSAVVSVPERLRNAAPALAGSDPQGPNDPSSWSPRFNPPTVAAFTGSSSYSYPILIPPGPGGFQPNLALAYNSASTNGAAGKLLSGPAGWGWNLGGKIEVAQTVELCDWNAGLVCPPDAYNNGQAHLGRIELTLSVGGTGYTLVHNLGSGENGYPGRYYVEGNAGLYVEFCHRPKLITGTPSDLCLALDDGDARADGAVTGTTDNGFWIVKTPDNVVHRLGYTADATQELTGMEDGSSDRMGPWSKTRDDADPNNYPGPYMNALRWQVDTSQDRFGNTISYAYAEYWPSAANGGWSNGHVHAPASYLGQVTYGLNRIRFNDFNAQTGTFALGFTSAAGAPPTSQPDAISWQTHRYARIRVEAQDYETPDGTYTTVRRYEMAFLNDKHGTGPGLVNDGLTDGNTPQTSYCDVWPANNLTGWNVSILKSITELDRNGRDILGNSGAATIPNAEFAYQFRRTGEINFFGTLLYKYCYPYMTDVY